MADVSYRDRSLARAGRGILLGTLALLLGACWADFPSLRKGDGGRAQDIGSVEAGGRLDGARPNDATGDGGVAGGDLSSGDDALIVADARSDTDLAVVSDLGEGDGGGVDLRAPSDGGGLRDAADGLDGGVRQDLSIACQAGEPVKCVDDTVLEVCNAEGTGTRRVSCAPAACGEVLGRCDACDPLEVPSCDGSDLVSCTPLGRKQSTPCALGCQGGACCKDGDSDSVTDCAGDCDDGSNVVYPGQDAWFDTAGSNGFDYNCVGGAERRWPDRVQCDTTGGGCTGAGWVTTVPDCGGGAEEWAVCTEAGASGKCKAQMESSRSQECH